MRGFAAILYARSGVMRAAFNAAGWDAIEVDIEPARGAGLHWQGDVFDFMETRLWRAADLVVLHPVCTWLSVSGLHWNNRIPGREACTLWSLNTVERLIERIERDRKRAVMENPVGLIGTKIRPATQTVQPYHFGDDASKMTCLWMLGGGAPASRDTRPQALASRPLGHGPAHRQIRAALGEPNRQRPEPLGAIGKAGRDAR